MEASFTDSEKRFVLAEMIKVSHMDVTTLVDFVRYHVGVQPDWFSMQLPGGRNMNQCLRAAEAMFKMPIQPPPMPPLKRKSLGDINEQAPKRQAIMSPIEPSPYRAPRSFSGAPPSINTQPERHPVNIQPRPSPNGYAGSPATPNPIVHMTTPTPAALPGRKRGRPSKAEKEAQARASSLQPTAYTPISPAPIAPLPGPASSSQPFSSSPIISSSYQVTSGSASEPKPKRKGRPPASERQTLAASVPRSIITISNTDLVQAKPGLADSSEPVRSGTTASDSSTSVREPTIPSGQDHRSASPGVSGTSNDTVISTLGNERKEEYPAASQA